MTSYTKKRKQYNRQWHAEIEQAANSPLGCHAATICALFSEAGYPDPSLSGSIRTYDSWKDSGRQVKRGQKGIGVDVVITVEGEKLDKRATFFHYDQTQAARKSTPKRRQTPPPPTPHAPPPQRDEDDIARECLIRDGVPTYGKVAALEVVSNLQPSEGDEVLVAQAGHGEVCQHLQLWAEMSGAFSVTATDTSKEAAAWVSMKYATCHEVDVIHAQGEVDRIAMMDFRPGYGKRIAHCLTLLKPGGRLVVLVPNPNKESADYGIKTLQRLRWDGWKHSTKSVPGLGNGAQLHIIDRT